MNDSLNLELGVVATDDLDSNYPSPQLENTLVKKISDKIKKYSGIETIPVIGAGSDQLLERLAFILSSEDNLHILPQPAYFSHIEYLQKNNARISAFRYDINNPGDDIAERIPHILSKRDHKNAFVWITTPNNPTGINIDIQKLLKYDVAIIVDEAYGEFSDKTPFSSSSTNYMNDGDVMILRSFSKGLGLAGTRLGYLLTANQTMADALRISLPLFPASRDTLEKGICAMDNYEKISEEMRLIGSERRTYFLEQLGQVQQSLDAKGIQLKYVHPQAITCMAWAHLGDKSMDLYKYLLDNNIYVQNLRNIEGVPDNAVRITMAEKDKTDVFMKVLSELGGRIRPKYLEYI